MARAKRCHIQGLILKPPERCALIDRKALIALFGIDDRATLSKVYKGWVHEATLRGRSSREKRWTQSLAVGSESFVERVKDQLGYKANGRKVVAAGDAYEPKEGVASYSGDSGPEMVGLRPKNSFKWNVSDIPSM